MKSVFVVAVFLFVAALDTVTSQNPLDIKCGGAVIKITAEHEEIMGGCLKLVGATTVMDLTAGTAGCFSKCFLEKENLVDTAGMPHKENILKAMDEGLPESLIEPWKKAMEDCLDANGSKIKPDDATCNSYLPLTMCLHGAYLKVCK